MQADASGAAERRRWSIANDTLELTIDARGQQPLWTLSDRAAGRVYGPSELPGVEVGGTSACWSGASSEVLRQERDGLGELRLTASDDGLNLALSCVFRLLPDRPFVQMEAAVHNRGAAPILLTGSTILRLAIAGEQHTLFHVEQFSWPYRREFFSQNQVPLVRGRTPIELRMGSFPSHYVAPSSCAWFALRDGAPDRDVEINNGSGLVAGVEFNGKSRLRAWAQDGGTSVVSTVDALAHELAPEGSFTVDNAASGSGRGIL